MQKLITGDYFGEHGNPGAAMVALRLMQDEGWRAVPGTTLIASVEYVPSPEYKGPRTPNNTAFRTMFSIVLEK